MRTPKKPGIPRAMLKNLVQDVKKHMRSNEGKLFLLEIFEEIPAEVRIQVLESMAGFHEPEMLEFYRLLKLEYGREYEETCDYAIKKIIFAGVKPQSPAQGKKSFYKAYATRSRHTGRMTIDVAWRSARDVLQVEGFYLTCHSEGIHSFFLAEKMSMRDYEGDRKKLPDMVAISYEEACFLIQHAYRFNTMHMTRPALGRFLYQDYLSFAHGLKKEEGIKLLQDVSGRQTPRQFIDSFFQAMKNQDLYYILSVLEPGYRRSRERKKCPLKEFLQPGVFTLQGQVDGIKILGSRADVEAHAIQVKDRDVYYCEYSFTLQKRLSGWIITAITSRKNEKVTTDFSPFTREVFCRAYNILDLDELLSLLEEEDHIRGMEELPYGIHMRYSPFDEEWSSKHDSLRGLVVDLVINGSEFVVMTQDQEHFRFIENLLKKESPPPVTFLGEHTLSLFMVYQYLGGRYLSLRDLLHQEYMDNGPEEYMRFLTVHYQVKDHERVRARLEAVHQVKFSLSETTQLYYQRDRSPHTGFMVEYMIGDRWLTLSTFGEKDMAVARRNFEKGMHESLEFEGLEIKDHGIFDILTPELKRRYPKLENTLKELYLNKWLNSRMAFLEGMTPFEASESESGSRLLWSMLKKIRDQEDHRLKRSGRYKIYINEYLSKLEQKKQGKSGVDY